MNGERFPWEQDGVKSTSPWVTCSSLETSHRVCLMVKEIMGPSECASFSLIRGIASSLVWNFNDRTRNHTHPSLTIDPFVTALGSVPGDGLSESYRVTHCSRRKYGLSRVQLHFHDEPHEFLANKLFTLDKRLPSAIFAELAVLTLLTQSEIRNTLR